MTRTLFGGGVRVEWSVSPSDAFANELLDIYKHTHIHTSTQTNWHVYVIKRRIVKEHELLRTYIYTTQRQWLFSSVVRAKRSPIPKRGAVNRTSILYYRMLQSVLYFCKSCLINFAERKNVRSVGGSFWRFWRAKGIRGQIGTVIERSCYRDCSFSISWLIGQCGMKILHRIYISMFRAFFAKHKQLLCNCWRKSLKGG